MAQGHLGPLNHDPAVERWYRMREDMYQKFRFTRSTTPKGLLLMVFIPGMLGWLATQQDVKWDWTAKRKGESLLRVPPKPAASGEDDA